MPAKRKYAKRISTSQRATAKDSQTQEVHTEAQGLASDAVAPTAPQLQKGLPSVGASGGSNSCKTKEFLNMKPPVFTESIRAEDSQNFMDGLQKVFHVMHATETEAWEPFRGEDASPVTWDEFVDAFIDHFQPLEVREEKAYEFERLRQNDMSVNDYYLKFVSLAKYAPHIIPDRRARVRQFVLGLIPDLHGDVNVVAQNREMTITKMGHFQRDYPSARQGIRGNVAWSTNSAAPKNSQAQSGQGAAKSGNVSGVQNHLYALAGRQDTEARTDVFIGALTVFTFYVYALLTQDPTYLM
ncbi:uncharacterized protein LOC132624110 [Lycium barbarum]|uniref:uncharacterized protein LOC132624110 n=1 Tax=Lycium barbarum TaxID=112863 RepID=UPI00293EA873|nr:uncharacterized protein LOC132624110 [Lycium barbarum]